jgi:hypothetical protein
VLLQRALQALARFLQLPPESFDLLFQLNELFSCNFSGFHYFVGRAICLSGHGADFRCSSVKFRLAGHSLPPI